MNTKTFLSIGGFSTRRSLLLALTLAITPFVSVFGVNFYDDFESGVGGENVWSPWGNVSGDSTTPNGINNLLTTDTAHAFGTQSAKAWASDPAAWNGFADFSATSDSLIASVYLYEDLSDPGTVNPDTCMLSLYGDSATQNPGAFTDYIQLGVVPFYPGGSQTYGFRTEYNDVNSLGIIDTGVSRKAGWTKLSIEVDSVADGGAVKFFIDDALVGTSSRMGVDLRWVRLGNNSKSYQNFWYDNVSVTTVPEPTSLALLGLGGLALLAFGRRRFRR